MFYKQKYKTLKKYAQFLEKQLKKLRDDLCAASANVDFEIIKNEDFKTRLDSARREIESYKHTIEAQQNEIHYMYENGYSAQERLKCPTDCVKHANPSPGRSSCRNCTRNPYAVDKYEKGETL